MTNTLESIARGEADAGAARSEVDRYIEATGDFAKPYSVLLRWAWLALSERRADDDLRHWHRLILDVAARAGQGECPSAREQQGTEAPSAHLAERLRALSDMIRVSIGMQTRPDKARLLTRAHVPAILQALYDRQNEAVARADLLQAVGLKTANLSRILTLLILEGLVERQADGRSARFRITGEGVKHLHDHSVRRAARAEMAEQDNATATTLMNRKAKPAERPKAGKPKLEDQLVNESRELMKRKWRIGKRSDRLLLRARGAAPLKKPALLAFADVDMSSEGHAKVAPEAAGFEIMTESKYSVGELPQGITIKIKGDQSSEPIRQGAKTVGGDLHRSGAAMHSPKPVSPEYTAFEAVLPARAPAKIADG